MHTLPPHTVPGMHTLPPHTAPGMHTLPQHTAPTRAVCVSDLHIQLLVAVCEGMLHMIFLGSSKGMHTAHNEIFKLTYIQFMFSITPFVAYTSRFVLYQKFSYFIPQVTGMYS